MGPVFAAVLSNVRYFRMSTLACCENFSSFDHLEYAENIAALSIEHCSCYEPQRETKLRHVSMDPDPRPTELEYLEYYSIQTRRNLPPIVAKLFWEAGSELESNMDLFAVHSWEI
jgi:hypothetical protein